MLLFSTDIDGTIYDGPDAAAAFAAFWRDFSAGRPSPPLLVYNTGRSLHDTRQLVRETGLPEPDWFICDVGTTIFDTAASEHLQSWREWLDVEWDSSEVREIVSRHSPAEAQPEESQGEFKCSWFWHGAGAGDIEKLEKTVRTAGIDAQAVYSSERDLDFLPARANKGNAVAFLAREIGIPLSEVVVAGDSGNDASMFLVDEVRGIVVANAESALKEATSLENVFHATRPCALGVMDGIEFHHEGEDRTLPSQSRQEA